jgi:carbon monoxide dehydrogenase subunit G
VQLQGTFEVNASQAETFRFLLDPQRLARYMPDVEGVEVEDDRNFTLRAKVGVSHIKGTMTMKLSVLEKQEPVTATLAGKGSGMASVVDMKTRFNLEEAGAGRTRVHWHGEAKIGGKLAALGGGLMDRLAKQNLQKFIAGIQAGMDSAVV